MGVVKACLLAWAISGTGTGDVDVYAVLPDGQTTHVGSPDDEDGWLTRAGIVADAEGQTVYVVQAGRVVCVVRAR
jgi:hypothetical protein